MKKLILLLMLFVCLIGGMTNAQTLQLWGMTSNGGVNSLGTIFKMNQDGTGFTTVYAFNVSTGYNPLGGMLVKTANNLLYGLNYSGGANNKGCLFSFDPSATTNAYSDLIDFDGINGARPSGNLTLATDGNLYGVTTYGGTNNLGVLFRFSPVTNVMTVLFNFSTANGTNPICTLLQGIDGKLYGTTNNGGISGYGVLFSYDISTSAFSTLFDFNNASSHIYHNPFGALIQANNGLLYGLGGGGSNGFNGNSKSNGTNFSFNPVGQSATLVHKFNYQGSSSVQENYNGYLVQEPISGKLFGLSQNTTFSDGKIYRIDPLNNNAYTETFNFSNNINHGENPIGGLLLLNGTSYYGVTKNGGAYGNGVVFHYVAGGNNITKLHDFAGGNNGANPVGNLIAVLSPCTGAPATPDSIFLSGINGNGVCPNDIISCNVSSAPGITYNWTAPSGTTISGGQGTNQITLIVSSGFNGTGILSVTASNLCGNSAPQTLPINSNQNPPSAPGIPVVSGGIAAVCPGDIRTYAVALKSNTTYNWTTPAGSTITSGQGTAVINVLFNNNFITADSLTVSVTNGCGTSPASSLNISRNIPATPGTITVTGGTSKVCPGDIRTFSVTSVAGITYNWTTPTGGIITNGQGTSSISVSFNSNFTANGTIGITASNGCNTSGVRTLAITRNLPAQPGAITEINGQPVAACPGDARIYGVTKVTGMTYTWTLPANATLLGGQGSHYIYVLFQSQFAGGTLKVKASNGCSTSTSRSLTIPLNLPSKPGTISGTPFYCPGDHGIFQINTVASATSYVWTSTMGPVINGQGTTLSVVHLTSQNGGTVMVAAANACGISPWRSYTANANPYCRGVEPGTTFSKPDAAVFPNPTNGNATLKFISEENEYYTLMISDVSGRVVMQEQITATVGMNEATLNMSQLVKGIYLLKIKTPSAEIIKKIIKD